jgi:hypothetical protein
VKTEDGLIDAADRLIAKLITGETITKEPERIRTTMKMNPKHVIAMALEITGGLALGGGITMTILDAAWLFPTWVPQGANFTEYSNRFNTHLQVFSVGLALIGVGIALIIPAIILHVMAAKEKVALYLDGDRTCTRVGLSIKLGVTQS